MGYSEVHCKLCRVSFNIGRVRRPDEPYSAAWNPEGGEPGEPGGDDFGNYVGESDCPASAGCQNVRRRVENAFPEEVEDDADDGEVDEFDDEYIYESEEYEELYEYESDSDFVEDEEKLEDEETDCVSEEDGWEKHDTDFVPKREDSDVAHEVKRDQSTASSNFQDDAYGNPKSKAKMQHCSVAEASAESVTPKSNKNSETNEDWHKHYREGRAPEHLAGPGHCWNSSGYSGFRITAAEMKGCATVQSLVDKSSEWWPQPDDQSFELNDYYFLSGLSGHMPSRDCGDPDFVPVRHGAEDLSLDTVFSDPPYEEETAMPFHPTCFEIFTRASRLRNNLIDIHGLAKWGKLESRYRVDHDFPRHEAVKAASFQWWCHRPSDEWLAANPVIVPLLPSLLRSAVHSDDKPLEQAYASPNDPLKRLPLELKDAILDLLLPTDVVSLRLASCATHLPILHWRELLLKEMPWLWEIWDDVAPSTWATATVSALAAKQQRYESAETVLNERRAIVQEEMPEIFDAWSRDHAKPVYKSYARVAGPSEIGKPIIPLIAENMNWCLLYYLIKTRWNDLKGLWNRQRIWTDIKEILRRIARYRDKGRIV